MPSTAPPLAFHGGAAGALLPFAVFLAGVGWLALSGAPDERGFWPILVAALACGLALARDRHAYSEALVAGMAQPLVLLMITAWLLAGVLSTLVGASGFVDALVWSASRLGLTGGLYVAASLLVCALVSTSTGTSFGTILICGPLLYPAGAAAGADPAVLLGAILGGATFGDNISPVSDTTIASAGTQQADIGGTVRSRVKYALPAAGAALVVALALGGGTGAGEGSGGPPAGDARGLPMLLVPVFVIALLLARRHLVEALLGGLVLAAAIGLVLGTLSPGQLLRIDAESFTARSLVIDGLERGVGVSIFTLLLVALVNGLARSGTLERLVSSTAAASHSARGVEARIVALASAAVLLTTHSVVAILTVGDVARDAGRRASLSGYRRANLLDVTVCTWPFLLPFFLPTILAAGVTVAGADVGFPRLSPLVAGLYNAYSWALVAMLLVAVVTGFGRWEGAGGPVPGPSRGDPVQG
jgi:Na+/H+ antiporter NhaC